MANNNKHTQATSTTKSLPISLFVHLLTRGFSITTAAAATAHQQQEVAGFAPSGGFFFRRQQHKAPPPPQQPRRGFFCSVRLTFSSFGLIPKKWPFDGSPYIFGSTTSRSVSSSSSRRSSPRLAAESSSSSSSSSISSSTAETTTKTTTTTTMAEDNDDDIIDDEDPYLWLEDVESEEALDFVRSMNNATLNVLGDPRGGVLGSDDDDDDNEDNDNDEETNKSTTYKRVLAVLESDERIPSVGQMGYSDDENNDPILYNFWKDSKNPKGLWRTTTLKSYKQPNNDDTEWKTILDVDKLAKQDGISWVWKGYTPLPRSRDPEYSSKRVTRALIKLSRGGSDAIQVREFDLTNHRFLDDDQPFNVPNEAKTRIKYKSRDVALIGTNFTDLDDGGLTDSGYPRVVREWVRGTKLEDAPIIFEGEKSDISASVSIIDERTWGGDLYEMHTRSITFYTTRRWIRKIQYEHLLTPDDSARSNEVATPPLPDMKLLDVPDDAGVGFCGKLMIISLRSDWTPIVDGPTYISGSLVYVHADTFIEQGASSDKCKYTTLFVPTERTAYEYYTMTKNYLILSIMDNVMSRLKFYRINQSSEDDDHDDRTTNTTATTLTLVPGGTTEPSISDCSIRPFDPYVGSDVCWYSSNDYLTPGTLSLANAGNVEDVGSFDAFITERNIKSLPRMYDSSGLIVQQQTAMSKDGTSIPYFIIRRENTTMDGSNPTLLYGYGGYEISLGPHYLATTGIAWLERGGVYIEGNIRGGGEFGPRWHQAASKANRNKSFEDFIAIAEHLIESKICTPKTLAVRGGSNGGLLVGNMYTMRPDLFGAIHCAVPLLDMKRYNKLLAGASWMAEYGNPDTDDWDNFLKDYSPYHNIDPNVTYPPILLTTSTRDDRVHPGHARKFVKKLKDVSKGTWPVYYYENIEGGHGGAADSKQSAFMTALAYDFMYNTLKKNADEILSTSSRQ